MIVHLEMNYHNELSFLKKRQMIVQNDSSFWKKVHYDSSLSLSSSEYGK